MTAESLNIATTSNEDAGRLMRRATLAALSVAVVLFVAKAIVWFATDSVALLGSALDSGLDIVATGLNFIAVRQALQPPDKEHRFGHGKAEALSGLVQGAFISGSALFLIIQALGRVFHPKEVDFAIAGAVVTIICLVVTLALVMFQRMVKRRTGSLAISADELHYRGDLILNAGVLVALVLSGPLKIGFADPVIGASIALFIAYSSLTIVRRSYDQLMDREFDDTERKRIAEVVHTHPEVIAMHDLRTRRSGRDAFIQFHLELAPNLKLVEAHRISDEVEASVRNAFPQAEVLIHEDPAGYEDVPSPLAQVARAN
jgi:ferrous-iron efflux pump FieF